MTVVLEGTIKRYIGLSADRKPGMAPKPIGEESPPAGSSFLEADRGRIFRFDGTDWWEQPQETRLGTLLEELIAEVRTGNELLNQWVSRL